MTTIIICADGPSFIICALAIAASIFHFAIGLCRAVKVVEERVAPLTNTQPPENVFHSHGSTKDNSPPAQTAPGSWNVSTKEDPEPARKQSFTAGMRTIGKRLSISRTKSFLSKSARKSSVDRPPPLPPPLRTDSHSEDVPVLAEPITLEDKHNPESARPRLSTLEASATIETRSATEDDGMQELEGSKEGPNIHLQMEPAQSTLAAPAAALAPMSTTTTSSSSSSSSTSPQPRARATPKGPRPRPASMSALGVDGRRRYAQPARPENSLPGEIFETRFENPFKPRSKSLTVKAEKASAVASDAPKRRSVFDIFSSVRRSLAKHKLGDSEAASLSASASASESPSSSLSSSRRTSVSSATGTTLSVGSGSGSTKSKWSCCVRNGVPRTDPYGPPYFAQMPVPSSEGRQARGRSRRA
ncbi:hypothetical protein LXA43DRAFT_1117341 [Ganoderma leucocontextum]|nr:hypothetical protein LXA43DRAFT_1117341 [Ganoderma leucocontextum]